MRRFAAAAAAFILILGLVRISVCAEEDDAPIEKKPGTWDVELNAKETGISAVHRDGRTYIEAKKILEAFGWVVFWNQGASQIAANSRDGDLFVHTIESAQSAVNGNSADYQTPSIWIDGTAYFPLSMLEPLLRADNIVEDKQRRIIHMYKTFETNENNKQVSKTLQAANLDNYDPLKFLEYLRYQADNPTLPGDKVILYVNIGVHIPPYSDIKTVENPHDVFAIVDKNHKFSDDFVPNLTLIDGFRWAKDAGDAWVRMKNAARADGVTLKLSNTYRSIADQRANYNRKIRSGRSEASVDRFNSRPGHSEHHTGYAADMAGLDRFVGTKAHSWLVKNGHQYGFIVSFQAGKEFINHYSPEGWHIRWFPVEDAKIMHDENLTIQEYDNLYLNPLKHGFSVDKSVARTIAETDYAVKWGLAPHPLDAIVGLNQ